MKTFSSLMCCGLMLFVFGCKKNVTLSDSKELTSFSIKVDNNPNVVQQDIVGVISEGEIKLDIPQGILNRPLKATFTFEGVKVTVNNTLQTSGQTVNDFSKDLSYTITAGDGSQKAYKVVVNALEDTSLRFNSFVFKKLINQSLADDVAPTKNGDTLQFTLKGYSKTLTPSFTSDAKEVRIGDVKQISGSTAQDFSKIVKYTLKSSYGQEKDVIVKVIWKNIAQLTITTTTGADVDSKENYLKAAISFEGNGLYPDYVSTTKIRGRGNSTWYAPKKPYKLKLDNKASLGGIGESKDYVLLANYLDPTQMLNAVALKAGQLLNMPYVNHIVPVDLVINGVYKGNYMLTEQVTVGSNRIDIENGGTLLELDSYFDEDYKFKSNGYNLPVNIKYPDLTSQSEIAPIKADFQKFEDLVKSNSFPNNNYADYIDLDQLANYLLVTNLVCNIEIGHPKSVYIFKPKNGKYISGPLWDYDWAFSYNGGGYNYFSSTSTSMFATQSVGATFYDRFFQDPVFKAKYKQKWNEFKANKMPQLLKYVNDYSALISDSYKKNYSMWNGGTGSLPGYTTSLKNWLNGRSTYMDNYVSNF